MIAAVSDWARGQGASRLGLWVVQDTDVARRSYRRAGFVATGETRPAGPGRPRAEFRTLLALSG